MSTAVMVTKTAGSKLRSRKISSLSSRLTTSFTRSKRWFIEFHHRDTEDTGGDGLRRFIKKFPFSVSSVSLWYPLLGSELLGDLFQSVALDDIANLVFIEVTELAAALDSGPDLFHIILEPPQSCDSAVINWLSLAQNSRPSGANNSAIGHEATGDCSLRQREHLTNFGMAGNGLPNFGIQHPDHGFFYLVDEFVDNAVKFDLNSFSLGRRCCLVFGLNVETDNDGIGSAG